MELQVLEVHGVGDGTDSVSPERRIDAAGLPLRLTMRTRSVTKSSEILNPYYQNASCDPFTPREQPCELGNYAVYSINVTGVEDVLAGLEFSRKKNIRLTIKNTGHE